MSERPKRPMPRFSAAARERLARALATEAVPPAEGAPLLRRERGGVDPLSTAQERLWLAEEILGPSPLYHVPLAARLSGPLDVGALERALNSLVLRHDVLRARFVRGEEGVHQHTLPAVDLRLVPQDLADVPPAEREARALALARRELRRPFDLAQGPPIRAALWRLGTEEHLLLLTLHHLVCDGASMRILTDELAEHYAAERAGRPLSLVEPELQHGDYARWQREIAREAPAREAVAHFVARLRGPLPALELPTDHPRPRRWTPHGAWRTRRLEASLGASLVELAHAHGATPFQLFLTAFHVLLHRLSGQGDLVVGIPIDLRERKELERMPGFLVNTLTLRTSLEGRLSFVEALARVRETALEATANRAAPFEAVVERAFEGRAGERDPARAPLFDVMFDHRANLVHELRLAGLASARLVLEDELHTGTSKVDLALYTELGHGGFRVSAEFRTDLFEPATIELLLERFEVLLADLAANPQARLEELALIGPGEREQLARWSRGPLVPGCETTVDAVLAERAAARPEHVALVHGTRRVSYRELEARANRLARHLIARGARPGEPIAVCLARTDELVVALLAILKSGGAYLPLDPNYPAERLRFMLADSGAHLLLTETALAGALPRAGLECLCLDALGEELVRRSADALPPRAGPGDPAYLIYTSGSTGTPKGVACPHRGVLRLFRSAADQEAWLRFDERVRMVHLAPESFDAAVLDIWGPLLGGGTLVLHPEKTPTLDGLARVVEEHAIDTLFLTTALFHALVDEAPETLARLRQVATGGEALSLAHLRRARERCPELAIANCYGPTEATVIATTWSAPRTLPDELASAPIGTPIGNTSVHVLDEGLRPVPLGVVGELVVGGDSIARGYWQRPELTRQRFVTLPTGEVGYRTGDRVRWRASAGGAVLEYLGRGDEQVKIRGHRIEAGEIEACLAAHPAVARALVVAREDVPGTKRLVAYVVPAGERPSLAELAAHAARSLPEYLRPEACVLLDELPITPGGKVDRARLPAPEATPAAQRSRPRGATEELLASLWSELLKVPDVAREDDFFALGGQSLAATVLAARVRRHLGLELPLAVLFRERSLANLARHLDQTRRGAERPGPTKRAGAGPAPLAPNQRGLWFLQKLAPASPFYNVPFALPLVGRLDVEALRRALAEIVTRHAALRTRFPLLDGEPVQVVDPPPGLSAGGGPGTGGLQPDSILTIEDAAPESGARGAPLERFAREPFDVERGPLFRARLVRESDERATLAINVHHLVFDGWSFEVFVRELAELYGAFARGRGAPLEAPALQYADHAAWLAAASAAGDAELAFWRETLAGAPPVLELPLDHPRPARPSWRGAKVQRALPAAMVARLEAFARAEGATPYLALLTLTQVLLARYAGVEDLVVGTPVAARPTAECEGLIGLFLNVLPIRADLAGAPSFREALRRTRERVLAAHAHQDVPFERIVEAVGGERDPAVTPIHQVLFSLRRASAPVASADLVLEPAVELDAASAKTDLAVTVEERPARDGVPADWLLDLTFATDLFAPATLVRLAEHFEHLLGAALAEPTRAVWELGMMGPAERARLEAWSGPTPDYPRDVGLAALFERIAARRASSIALVLESETLSYGALNERANRLARQLVALGVQRGHRVGLCLERSFDMLTATLAILKAGGAYVPLDPGYPPERLAFMLHDAGIAVLLTDGANVERLPETGARKLVVEELDLDLHPGHDLPARAAGGDPAYVMYTSGSTGKPKGVVIPQRAIARLVLNSDFARLDETRTWLQLAPISFDAATLEIWGAFLHGARLVLCPERVPTPEELERVLLQNGVTSLWLTAALFNALVDERPQALAGVDQCLTGGEALSVAHVRRAYAALPATVELINGYGPTENTTFTCCHPIPRDLPADTPSIPIGRPIANTKVHVVDARLAPVPIGVPGELVTGGDGLALGYLERPELDAERFVPNPFGPGKLYRTGDRVRWLADGTLEFLGRIDDQVKIRGHRIEPGEVATLLGTHPGLAKAFVTVHVNAQGEKLLVAYVEARAARAPEASELTAWLAERLPDYMVPSAFVALDALPMNQNGKVDRRRLPEPVFAARSGQRPRNEMEAHLAALWEQILGVEGVGPEDDFFELGGHSLLAVKLVQAIREAFGQELELSELLAAPTLVAQAQRLYLGVGTKSSGAVVKLQPKGTRPPVFCVCSLGGTVLNQRPLALRLGPDQPFHGLQAIDLERELGHPAAIEDYAAAYVAAMKKVAPRGPYVIGGHSFGGIVSYEIAQQLTHRGDEVALLFILDSALPNLDKSALDRLASVFAFLRGLPYVPAEALSQLRRNPEELTRALRQKLRFVAGKAKGPRPLGPPPAASPAVPTPTGTEAMDIRDVVEMSHWPENNQRIAARHWAAVMRYRPKPYPGRITLFRSRFQSPFLGLGSMMGWDRVALGGVEVVRVPGGHLSVLQPPNVDVLARRLVERLQRRRLAA
ncbi:MAG TPA: amino acid adenylation domain-containing protein [Planctomycetota bacterium]